MGTQGQLPSVTSTFTNMSLVRGQPIDLKVILLTHTF